MTAAIADTARAALQPFARQTIAAKPLKAEPESVESAAGATAHLVRRTP
jgi:hypothetical protein